MAHHDDQETEEYREDLKLELHRAMRHTNDLITRAAKAGLSVDVQTLQVFGTDGARPQITLAVLDNERHSIRPV